jgi:hypothetical protein
MWQLYVLGSLLASAGENVIDKAALVKNVAVDFYVASFWRPFMYFIAISAIGLTGILGPLHFFFHWSILAIAPFGIFTSLFYTYMLRKVELTSISAAAYLTPIIFLFVDANFIHATLSIYQIAGILLLVLGGLGFALDRKTFRIKKQLVWQVWLVFLFNVLWAGTEAYLFKYLNATYGMNGGSFFATLWLICSLLLVLLAITMGKWKLLFTKPSLTYVSQTMGSKFCDGLSSVFWAQAIALAAVSQVYAFEALFPLVLFLAVLLVQGGLHIRLKETFGKGYLGWKAVATVLLVVGGFLVS